MLENITYFIEHKFSPVFQKLNQIPYFVGLKNGIIITTPFTIVGSLFIIIQQFPVQAWLDIVEPYQAMLGVPNQMTIGVIGLYTVFGVAYNVARELKIDALGTATVATMAFLMLQIEHETFTFVTSGLGARGIFSAILMAMFTAKIMHLFLTKGWYIKFPDGVPPAVSKTFASLTPAAVIMVVMFILSVVLETAGGTPSGNLMYQPFVKNKCMILAV
ncbi:MAG: PTS transporter subunit EIIC, partial [Streptococcaceae bacterium]|nr:PTS transporter subunit EIIC [Streptococcaceae bacterium]